MVPQGRILYKREGWETRQHGQGNLITFPQCLASILQQCINPLYTLEPKGGYCPNEYWVLHGLWLSHGPSRDEDVVSVTVPSPACLQPWVQAPVPHSAVSFIIYVNMLGILPLTHAPLGKSWNYAQITEQLHLPYETQGWKDTRWVW